jgi:zinc transporter, ZIP family
MLGMAAGAMVLVPFVELLGRSIAIIGFIPAIIAFFGGMIGIYLIEVSIPHSFMDERQDRGMPTMAKTGMMVALGPTIHNFPQDLAVSATALPSTQLCLVLTIAVAVHNIPEGIAVALPVFSATENQRKAIIYAFLSRVAEPVGALVGAAVLLPFLTQGLMSTVLAAVAGFMVFISLDEFLPAAHRYGKEHSVILGM